MAKNQALIAVIDDEPAVCRALKRLLTASKFDVVSYASGEAFLESLVGARPDCLVLDLHMPRLSGLDLMRMLTNAGHQIPTIMITGRDEQGASAACKTAGAHAYLPKPLDPAKLLQAISEALESSGRTRSGEE